MGTRRSRSQGSRVEYEQRYLFFLFLREQVGASEVYSRFIAMQAQSRTCKASWWPIRACPCTIQSVVANNASNTYLVIVTRPGQDMASDQAVIFLLLPKRMAFLRQCSFRCSSSSRLLNLPLSGLPFTLLPLASSSPGATSLSRLALSSR